MIYTSYFAKYKGKDGISIARYTPKWFNGDIYLKLAPEPTLLYEYRHKLITIDDFEDSYRNEVLSKLYPEEVIAEIGDNRVLLCYEKSSDFCHRHIVRAWLKEHGILSEELTNKD